MNKNDKIESLLNELAEIGGEGYKPDARDSMSKWAKIGMAISHAYDSPKNGFEIVYEWLEDWNYHAHCAVIDWIIRPGNKFWDCTLDYMKKMIDKNNVEIIMWNEERTEIVTKHAKVTVNIEWLD